MIDYYIHKKDLKEHYPNLIKKLRWTKHHLMYGGEILFHKSTIYKNTYTFHFRFDSFHNRMVSISKVSKSSEEIIELIRFILKYNYEKYDYKFKP